MEKSIGCDSFELIDEDEIEQATAERHRAELEAPWIRPDHPLYFADTQSSLADRSADLEAFGLERWYTALAEHTFKTVWVPMTADEVRAVYYTHASSSPKEVATTTLAARIDESIRANFGGNKKVLDGERVDETGEVEQQQQPPSVFLRLSTRSPKDSTALEGSAVLYMASDRTYWPPTSDPDDDDNDGLDKEEDRKRRQMWRENRELASYTAAMLQGLKVNDGATAVKVIAGSHKAACDMEALLSKACNNVKEGQTAGETHVADDNVGITCIILREWVDMRIDHEFRVFVAQCSDTAEGENGRGSGDAKAAGAEVIAEGEGGDKEQLENLSRSAAEPSKFAVTGITQYFHYLNFDFLEDGVSHWSAEERHEIGEAMSDFVLTNIVPHANTFLPSRRTVTTTAAVGGSPSEKQGSPHNTCASSCSEFIVDLALIPIDEGTDDTNTDISDGGGENGVEGKESKESKTNGHGCDEIQDKKVKKGGKRGDLLQIRGRWYRLVIIELNPFAPAATGGMLFDWKKDLHILWPRQILPNITEAAADVVRASRPSPVFRIRDELRENYDNISLLPWGYEETIRQATVARKGVVRVRSA